MEKCEFCDCDLGEFVQYQSYFFKCLSCKQTGPSTSFDSIKDQLTGIYEVFVTDEDLKDKKMICKDFIENIFSNIGHEAATGKLVYFKKDYKHLIESASKNKKMKNSHLVIIISLILISCSNSDDTNQSFEIDTRFTHLISDCDNSESPEINCVEFVEFIDNSTVEFLIGGGDIVFNTNYQVNDDKIEFEKVKGLNFKVSFVIKNDSTLKRIEDDEIWLKTE